MIWWRVHLYRNVLFILLCLQSTQWMTPQEAQDSQLKQTYYLHCFCSQKFLIEHYIYPYFFLKLKIPLLEYEFHFSIEKHWLYALPQKSLSYPKPKWILLQERTCCAE